MKKNLTYKELIKIGKVNNLNKDEMVSLLFTHYVNEEYYSNIFMGLNYILGVLVILDLSKRIFNGGVGKNDATN